MMACFAADTTKAHCGGVHVGTDTMLQCGCAQQAEGWVGSVSGLYIWRSGLPGVITAVQEGRNLAEFAAAHSYLGFVDTPQVVWELTTQR